MTEQRGMTTEQMKALPFGTRVTAVRTGVLYEKVGDYKFDRRYKCAFRKVGKRGLSGNETYYFGSLVKLAEVSE